MPIRRRRFSFVASVVRASSPAAILATAVVLTGGCRREAETSATAAAAREAITVLVAASTQEPVARLAERFGRAQNVDVRLVADDSSKLAQQIVYGAPASAFLSAAVRWADHLQQQGLVAQRRNLLGNELVLVVPAENPRQVRKPEDLLAAGVTKVGLAGPTVPAGAYARQALTKLNLLAALEEQRKIVSGDNVRAALAYAERGEADAAIVYRTDARISAKVAVVFTFPADAHDPIVYPWVLLKTPEGAPAAESASARFYEYLASPEAAEVFRAQGFTWLGAERN